LKVIKPAIENVRRPTVTRTEPMLWNCQLVTRCCQAETWSTGVQVHRRFGFDLQDTV